VEVSRFSYAPLRPGGLQHQWHISALHFQVPNQHVDVAKPLLMFERRPGQVLIHWHRILLLSVQQGVGTSTAVARNPNRLSTGTKTRPKRGEPKRSLSVHQYARALHPRSIATGPQPLLFRFWNNLWVCIKRTFILQRPCHCESRCQVERRSARSFL
jgi:hypothetical protein